MVTDILGSKYATVSVSGRFSFIKWETQNNIGLNTQGLIFSSKIGQWLGS